MNQITLRAAAKLNFTLDITGLRSDGYHLLQMVMQTVSLYDTVDIRKADQISLEAEELATPENLVWKAANVFFSHTGIQGGAAIRLEKKIPSQAGLAGGSADAAAVLHGLNHLYETHLSLPELRQIGLPLGADIPYCLTGGTAMVEGIGEKIFPTPQMRKGAVVIIKPEWGVSTAAAFRAFDSGMPVERPDSYRVVDCLMKSHLEELAPHMRNVLEQASDRLPEIRKICRRLTESGAFAAQMTGSGSAVFGVFPDMQAAQACAQKIALPGEQVFAAEPVPTGVEILSME
ncbi:MAG: 4-(cytidine 5'-diphospho)-2-C-methyl-D-erythritol kinase [Candidatus Merdivicinus sp.]|jgi:4-diphosphocytidyl-2-C-methyl-D-erythritol kinase